MELWRALPGQLMITVAIALPRPIGFDIDADLGAGGRLLCVRSPSLVDQRRFAPLIN